MSNSGWTCGASLRFIDHRILIIHSENTENTMNPRRSTTNDPRDITLCAAFMSNADGMTRYVASSANGSSLASSVASSSL